jgi:hypothetical protein
MRSLALVLTGVWLGALLASWVAATVNFRTVDRVLGAGERPELARSLGPVAPDARRQALRHLSSEINRWSFRWWSRTQLVLAIVLVLLSWRHASAARWLLLASVVIVLAQLALVRPIVDLGRAIDFVPRPLPAEVARRFGMLHAAFVVSDLIKAGLLAAAAFALGRR